MVDGRIIVAIVISVIVALSIGSIENLIINSAAYVIKGFGCEDNPSKPGVVACTQVKSVSLDTLLIAPAIFGCGTFLGTLKKLS